MDLANSTLTGPHRAVTGVLGGKPISHTEVATLLLPMVRRAVRTERGPAALVSWLRRYSGSLHAGDPAQGAALAEGLARLLSAPFGSPADTLADSRGREAARLAPDAP